MSDLCLPSSILPLFFRQPLFPNVLDDQVLWSLFSRILWFTTCWLVIASSCSYQGGSTTWQSQSHQYWFHIYIYNERSLCLAQCILWWLYIAMHLYRVGLYWGKKTCFGDSVLNKILKSVCLDDTGILSNYQDDEVYIAEQVWLVLCPPPSICFTCASVTSILFCSNDLYLYLYL